MAIKIAGGVSRFGRISISSDEFTSTARCCRNGEIVCKVERISWLNRFLSKRKYLPIPKTLRLVLSLCDGMQKTIVIIGLFFGIVISEVLGIIFRVCSGTDILQKVQDSCWSLWPWMVGIAVCDLVKGRIFVARWHGAEHMAIASYEKNASAAMGYIKMQSRIHPKCGGRLVLPLILGAALSAEISSCLNINISLTLILCLEVVLWTDTLLGWEKIWGFSTASILLQKYLTTCKPGETELETAQTALKQLIKAHQSL